MSQQFNTFNNTFTCPITSSNTYANISLHMFSVTQCSFTYIFNWFKILYHKKSQSINASQLNHLNSSDLITSIGNENVSFIDTTSSTYPANSSSMKFSFYMIFYIIVIISLHISYLSYSINFFLYSFCGMKFRRELLKCLTRYGKYRGQRQISRPGTAQNSF